jgi:heme-degrading monooxygenase HmoA
MSGAHLGEEDAAPVMEIVEFRLNGGGHDGLARTLEVAVAQLQQAPGYLSHAFGPCVEQGDTFFLLVHWTSLDAHTVGFRNSPEGRTWRALLASVVDEEPIVRHFQIQGASA